MTPFRGMARAPGKEWGSIKPEQAKERRLPRFDVRHLSFPNTGGAGVSPCTLGTRGGTITATRPPVVAPYPEVQAPRLGETRYVVAREYSHRSNGRQAAAAYRIALARLTPAAS